MGNKFLHSAESAENVREKVPNGHQNIWNICRITTIERVISERNAVLKVNCPFGLFQDCVFRAFFKNIVAKGSRGVGSGIGGLNESIYRNFVCESPELPFVQHPSVVSYGYPFT